MVAGAAIAALEVDVLSLKKDLGSTRLEISANPTGSTRLRVYGVTSGNRRVCHSAVWRVPPSTSLTTAGC